MRAAAPAVPAPTGSGMTTSEGHPHEPELLVRLIETFVRVADTLVGSYDVAEMLHVVVDSSVELLGCGGAGLLLLDRRGELQVAASSGQGSRLLEVLQAQDGDGPCAEAVRTGSVVLGDDPQEMAARWPLFAKAADVAGYRSVCSVPLSLGSTTMGSLNLFDTGERRCTDERLRLARALADLAAVSLVQAQAAERNVVLIEQLEAALHSRVAIEQAKGLLAEAYGVDVSAAFSHLLRYARNHNHKLSDVARRVAQGHLTPAELGPP